MIDNEEKIKVTKKKKKKRRRKENFVIITAVFLALFVFLGGKYVLSVMYQNKTQIQNKNNENEQKNTSDNNSEGKQNTTEKEPEKQDSNGIDFSESGSHIKSADSYAYDTAEIRDYIMSKKEYTGKKIVFLTFDDGVTPGITDKVLDILKEKQVPATFFIVGKTLNDQAKPYLERELKEGHGIAIHSFSHDYNKLYPNRVPNASVIKDEAEKTLSRLKELLGDKFNTGVWRYPGGHMSWKGLENAGNGDEVLKSLGLEWIDWNSLSGDAEPQKVRPTNKEEMLKYVKTSLSYWKQQNVAVVLMHDSQGKNLTVETLPSIIDYFKSNGYEFGILK
ncbi:polysaccharide deacetylase family protein [Parvimonas micra]|uniref:polysaccharide deacetylase family protein n=1 Tax=Parvimonas micra TaxID=33033 RepID=UPI0030D1465B